MCETMFEKYSAPAVFISKDAVLASYSCGKSGGLVIDIGASGTVVTPVQDGWVETKGMCRSFAGGRLIDAHIRNNVLSKVRSCCLYSSLTNRCLFFLSCLQRKAHLVPTFRLSRSVTATEPIGVTATPKNLGSVHPSYDAFMGLELARDIKESLARVADSTLLDADPRYANIPTTPYELPDGTVVEVNIERFQISELLFDPSPMAKLDSPELQALYGNTPSLAPGSMDSVPKIVGKLKYTMTIFSPTSLVSQQGNMCVANSSMLNVDHRCQLLLLNMRGMLVDLTPQGMRSCAAIQTYK